MRYSPSTAAFTLNGRIGCWFFSGASSRGRATQPAVVKWCGTAPGMLRRNDNLVCAPALTIVM